MQGEHLHKRYKNTTRSLAIWTIGWLLSLAVAQFGPLMIWSEMPFLTILAMLINLFFGVKMLLANRNHLLNQDELQRKIQLDAMAVTLGAGLIIGILYDVASNTGLINADAQISHLVIFMGLTYIGAIVLGQRKYQ
ncbi:hypothetical protein [Lacimicrobium sp. SS2-24]|uniref:hypothetical protein n=1 Tax=Lacimicrobium sp. SS2-24 TaxID=2005569 RepID=UPI000B4AEAC8|nr:hypothetical protein [Lacimicrobium sp. SS2-24]